jgi:hypothetical protein
MAKGAGENAAAPTGAGRSVVTLPGRLQCWFQRGEFARQNYARPWRHSAALCSACLRFPEGNVKCLLYFA